MHYCNKRCRKHSTSDEVNPTWYQIINRSPLFTKKVNYGFNVFKKDLSQQTHHCKEVHHSSNKHKQMPNRVVIFKAAPYIKHSPNRINNSTNYEEYHAVCWHRCHEWFPCEYD